ncbi:hypothetical protein N9C10_04455 [Flavobacteriaceae bacterium]|nr:hypothetical protein [Flavobacteriaceae bacterium]
MNNLEEIPKKIQYLNVDSQYVNGTGNVFSVDLSITSNAFVEEMRDVIGIKVVDFFIMQVGETGNGTGNSKKYIDIICPDVPTPGQMLSERSSQILSRIPLERNYEGSTNYRQHDKQWSSWNRKTNYFNPISIKKLNFELYEGGFNTYRLLEQKRNFYFTLEITTIDRKAPPKDTNLRVVKAINKLCNKVDELNENVQRIPEPPPPKPKIPLRNIVGVLLIIGVSGYVIKNKLYPPPTPPIA